MPPSPMTEAQLTRRVRSMLAVAVGVSEADLKGEVSQATVPGWTSLRHLALMATLEEELDVIFSVTEMTGMTSLEKIVATVQEHSNRPATPNGDLSSRLAAFVKQNAPVRTTQRPTAAPSGSPRAPEPPQAEAPALEALDENDDWLFSNDCQMSAEERVQVLPAAEDAPPTAQAAEEVAVETEDVLTVRPTEEARAVRPQEAALTPRPQEAALTPQPPLPQAEEGEQEPAEAVAEVGEPVSEEPAAEVVAEVVAESVAEAATPAEVEIATVEVEPEAAEAGITPTAALAESPPEEHADRAEAKAVVEAAPVPSPAAASTPPVVAPTPPAPVPEPPAPAPAPVRPAAPDLAALPAALRAAVASSPRVAASVADAPGLPASLPDRSASVAGDTLALPRSLGEYLRNPRATWTSVSEWLNARWQLRACDAVGKWTRLIGRVTICNQGRMVIGSRVRIYSHHARSIFTTFPGGTLEIGDDTVVNYGVDIAATGRISIGKNCMIGTHVSILDNDFHDLFDRDRMPAPRPVIVEDGAWIADRAIIMSGVTIGAGAAVGAGSVVIADVPPRTLAMGNPARIVKEF